jgi:hypothetical protein
LYAIIYQYINKKLYREQLFDVSIDLTYRYIAKFIAPNYLETLKIRGRLPITEFRETFHFFVLENEKLAT